jgi:NAD-dependent SIR2 family protein deacetylase
MANGKKVSVYVFGAGASVHAGAPLGKEFLLRAFNLFLFFDGSDMDDDKVLKVASYIDKLYDIGLSDGLENDRRDIDDTCLKYLANMNIEDLLTFVGLELREETSSESGEELRETEEALHYFIFRTLEESLKGSFSRFYKPRDNGEYDWKPKNCYDKLLMNRIDKDALNVMISFNYDLLLDRSLAINNEDVFPDYSLRFSHIVNFNRYKYLQRNVPFLKLHGSLNWGYCAKCDSMTLYSFERYENLLKEICLTCGNRLTPVLIPPTYLKNIGFSQLPLLWDQAEKLLQRADEITIIGYSFPDADIEAKWLFKKSLARNSNKPILTIVEPNEQVRDKIQFFLGNFFRNKPLCFDRFEEYCEGDARK